MVQGGHHVVEDTYEYIQATLIRCRLELQATTAHTVRMCLTIRSYRVWW